MQETLTDKKQRSVMALVFNENSEVLVIPEGNGLRLPGVNVDPNTDPQELMSQLVTNIKEATGSNAGLGDLVFDDYADDGTPVYVFLAFLESYDDLGDCEWTGLKEIEHGKDDELMNRIRLHLNNTLFNPQVMKMGNCYENIMTGEAYYVIHIINDTHRQKNFLVLESTMADEPIVLPSDAFWGVPMKWVTHLRFAKIVQSEPETIAEKAKEFFINKHNMVNQRYDGKPYSYHLGKVVEQFHKYKHLIPEEDHDYVEAELWGHDGIEDARLTYNDVKNEFDERLAEGCYSLTNEKGRNRKERANDKYYQGLAEDKYGEFKKLCDRLANATESVNNGHGMLKAHRKELDSFESKLRTHGDTYKPMWDDLRALLGNEG